MTSSTTDDTSLSALNIEAVIHTVLQYCDVCQLIKCSVVNHQWRRLVHNNPTLWENKELVLNHQGGDVVSMLVDWLFLTHGQLQRLKVCDLDTQLGRKGLKLVHRAAPSIRHLTLHYEDYVGVIKHHRDMRLLLRSPPTSVSLHRFTNLTSLHIR